MADSTYSAGSPTAGSALKKRSGAGRYKFIAGGLLILAAVVYLIATATQTGSQYYVTIEELLARQGEMAGQNVRVSGVVLGDTIQYDPATLDLTFTVAHIPGDDKEIAAQGGLAMVLHEASIDPSRPQMKVLYNGAVPDLLQNEAQAIMVGKIQPDGTFVANELLLKCPTKYEEAVPNQVEGG